MMQTTRGGNSGNLFAKEIKFLGAATSPQNLQKFVLPEIAFFGKSNVGKSSLINALCRRKSLARVSKTPGCTRQINFFSISDKFILADLPGYGFSKVSAGIADSWERLVLHYLSQRANLCNIILLVDARRGLKDNDSRIINLMHDYKRAFDVVFTKVDKMPMKDLARLRQEVLDYVVSFGQEPKIFFTSSRSNAGMDDLRRYVQKIVKL